MGGNRKWFALVMNVKRGVVDKSNSEDMVDIINLKIDPKEGERLFQMPGIYPAYHMNPGFPKYVTCHLTTVDLICFQEQPAAV